MSHDQDQHDAANIFALNLLMPEEKFLSKINSGMVNVGELANHFKVPAMAVRHRARILGLSGHGLRKGFRAIGTATGDSV